jgi:O-Antigen ligase
MLNPRERILPPYTKRVDDNQHRLQRILVFTGLILFAMLMGFFIAVLPIQAVFIPVTPIVLMFLVALWMAPDVDPHLDKPIIAGYFVFFYVALIWPNYIAFNLPGLPWISMQRLVMFVVLGLGLYALASSSRMRGEVKEVMSAHPVMLRLFLAWVVIQAIMMVVAGGTTISRWIHYQIVWNFLFMISAWIHCRPGMPTKIANAMIIGCAITAVLAVAEVQNEKPIWADNIPAFLGVDPTLLEILQSSQGRSGDGLYRARSIHLTSVNYAEFIGVFLPFVLHAIIAARSALRRVAAILLLVLLFSVALMTNARSALVAFVVGIPFFAFIWAFRRFKTGASERDLIGPASIWAIPVAGLTIAAAVLFIGRVRVRVLGGGQHQSSDDGRSAQWDMAMPKMLQNPVGYGVDKAGDVVPYTNLAGVPTIDAYPINLIIDYGVVGFLVFVGLFLTAIYVGVKSYWRAETPDEMIAGPAAGAILAFLVSRLILSAEGAQFIAFALAGMILAIHWRQEQRVAAAAPVKAPVLPPRYPLPPRTAPALTLGGTR